VTRLLYVTGVSCAGKTDLGRALNEHEGIHWVDLDEHADNRPKTAWLDWLRWRAAELLHEADTKADNPVTPPLVVVTGIVWPFRVIESPAWPAAVKNDHLEINWLMLDRGRCSGRGFGSVPPTSPRASAVRCSTTTAGCVSPSAGRCWPSMEAGLCVPTAPPWSWPAKCSTSIER
jgi:hypothetical protein